MAPHIEKVAHVWKSSLHGGAGGGGEANRMKLFLQVFTNKSQSRSFEEVPQITGLHLVQGPWEQGAAHLGLWARRERSVAEKPLL